MSSFEKIPTGIFNKVENNKEIFVAEFKEKLQEFFPSSVKDGIVDFEALLNEFGKYAETDEKEKYNMTWVGKKEAIKTANEDIIGKTLKYVPEDSKNPETTQNLYIEGDNLEVLKLLRNSYYGKVKMIYIDPPYNTGNDFIYNDKFKIDREEYEKLEGTIDQYNERLTASKKGSGRYHSNWMNMMYPRLKLAKDLLSDDGVIFISIDDNELDNLKKICDEILGEENFVSQFNWKRKKEISSDSKNVAVQGEYILCYSKSYLTQLKFESISQEYIDKSYNDPNEEFPLGKWRPVPITVSKGLSGGGYTYTIKTPTGVTHTRLWAYPEKSYKKLFEDGRVYFGKDKNGIPQRIIYAHESKGQPVSNYWDDIATNKQGKKEILNILGDNVFDTPKPVELIMKSLNLITNNKDNDIILDFFSGSATTAHAIMKLNAEDAGNRKFIMVQLPELCNEKSEAYKNDFKTICDIGRKRINLAGEKIKEENKDKEGIENLDVGFKVFKVSDTNIRWISDAIKSNDGVEEKDIITQEQIMENETYKDRLDFNPWFTDLDVVYEMMLKRQDIELTERIDKLTHIGDRTYLVGYTILVCLEENITEEMVRKISEIETSLSWIVFRDSAFEDDINLKTNTINLLRTLIKEKNPRNKNQKILWI